MDKFLKLAILFIIVAIILGAFTSHTLKIYLSLEQINSFQIGIKYQISHAFALLILSLNKQKFNSKLKLSLFLMTIGIITFSFSIYFLNIQDLFQINLNFLGPVTPFGGILLLIAWINLFFTIKKND